MYPMDEPPPYYDPENPTGGMSAQSSAYTNATPAPAPGSQLPPDVAMLWWQVNSADNGTLAQVDALRRLVEGYGLKWDPASAQALRSQVAALVEAHGNGKWTGPADTVNVVGPAGMPGGGLSGTGPVVTLPGVALPIQLPNNAPVPSTATVVPPATATTGGAAAPATAAPDPAIAARNRATFDTVAKILAAAGLGELYTIDPATGSPGGWLWDQVTDDVGAEAILLRLEETEPFKREFGVIFEMRKLKAGNPGVYVPTPADVLTYRNRVRTTMKAAGLPSWFYDETSDFDNLMVTGLSPVEVEERLGEAWTMVNDSNPAIKAAFRQFYGVADGEAAMAAFFLDPGKTQNKLETAARAAFTAGRGSTLGLTIGKDVAEAVAGLPMSDAAINAGLGDASSMSALANETLGEGGDDITDETLVSGTLLGDGAARARAQRRLIERQGVDRQSGGAALTTRGVVGVG